MADWSASTLWWVIAGVLVVAELTTGTLYLLLLALGAAAGALAAHAGLGAAAQVVIAAVVGAGFTLAWKRRRRGRLAASPASRNRNVNLDIGQGVQVDAWQPDGQATIQYRGAAWQAQWIGTGEPAPGPHVIRAIEGSRLQLDR